MKKIDSILDADGETLQEGDPVILLNAPDDLLLNLPSEDQVAIRAQVGKSMQVQGFDEHGNVELEFKDDNEMIHFIWIGSSHLRKTT